METNNALFEERIKNGNIRDCHGDLHSGNIFITDKICIFDAIEFNDRFRYSDVASDIAFLAMDLDYQKRADLSDYLIEKYIEYSKDRGLNKVACFLQMLSRVYPRKSDFASNLTTPSIKDKERAEAVKDAQAYFKLSAEYARKM